VHAYKGDYDKALDYYGRSLAIEEEIGDKYGMGFSLNNIGNVHWYKGDYKKAEEYLEKSLAIQKEIGLKGLELKTTTSLYLTYKHLGKDYDVKEIHTLIKETESIEFALNYAIYQLLEDTSYLESAYNQVQEKASAMEDELAAKFLSYPIPKAIVEEWEKVK
jgi:tetratricopeptide (TPR) repeat protein